MIKIVCMFTRKPSMSRAEFIDYYETNHAPLISRLLPQPYRYQRSYVIAGTMLGDDTASRGLVTGTEVPQGHFDVITEAWFRTQEDYDAMLAARNDPKIASVITADEANFMDRSRNIVFLAEERITK